DQLRREDGGESPADLRELPVGRCNIAPNRPELGPDALETTVHSVLEPVKPGFYACDRVVQALVSPDSSFHASLSPGGRRIRPSSSASTRPACPRRRACRPRGNTPSGNGTTDGQAPAGHRSAAARSCSGPDP